MNTLSKLIEKLHDPEYRRGFVGSQIKIGIPFQIRALLKSRGWTQGQLAEKAGMRQPSISALMKTGNSRPNIGTLVRLAEAFDCGLAVRFVSFGELARWSDSFDPEAFDVPEFSNDSTLISEDPIGKKSGALEFLSSISGHQGAQESEETRRPLMMTMSRQENRETTPTRAAERALAS